MEKHYSLGIYDYDRQKICDLYDSQNDLIGQAYDIKVSTEINGYHTLEFNIPYAVDQINIVDGGLYGRYGDAVYGRSLFGINEITGAKNFRWDLLKSDHLIRYACDGENIWFVADKPSKEKSGKQIVGSVKCSGFEALLKTRNIYAYFDDENGIGTIQYLMRQILKGTGWSFNERESDILYENDGVTEKIRSLNADEKKGALDLISTVCNLFQARPVFDTENMEVYIKSIKNRVQVLEGEIGRNLDSIGANYDSSDICTRIYVEGEYGDDGYVGIDDVIVDGEKYGLPFIMNFDYYRSIGVFKQRHEDALATYLHDIRIKKEEIRQNGQLMIEAEDNINSMIGQCKMVLYYKDQGLDEPAYTYGELTDAQKELNVGDEVVILKTNGTHTYEEWTGTPSVQLADAYGVAKFVTKPTGKIGTAEVQIEAKQKTIEQLERKISVTVKPDKIAEYEAEIARLRAEIATIYYGNEEVDGLFDMMYELMKEDGMFYIYSNYVDINTQLNEEQDDIESDFIMAMGYMLRDGYWGNNNYVIGQEEFLYADAVDMAKEMSRPTKDYKFSYVRVTEDFDIPTDEIDVNAIFKVHDDQLDIDDKMYIKKVTFGVDDKSLGSIEVSNQDIALTGNDLGSLLSRMSQLADLIEQKNALYERSKALTRDGSLYTDRLNGQIDVLKTQLLSSVSNWFTDDNGNILFLSADGGSAMMLSGAGFMIADGKTEDGEWNWRSFGDGHGFTADEIVAGFISADRIEAGSISTSKVTADFGRELILSSEQYIELSATNFDSLGNSGSGIYLSPTEVKINSGGTFELHSTNLDVSTDGTVSARNLSLTGGSITLSNNNEVMFSVTNNGYMTSKSGNIAGWDITNTTLTGNKTGIAKTTNDDDIAFWAGNATAANGTFRVTQGGALTATNATIQGAISSSTISGTTITGGSISIGNAFSVSNAGVLNATGATISGTLTAGANSRIGGWNIGATTFYSGTGSNTVTLDSGTAGQDYAIWAGNASTSSAPFKVKRNGEVTLTKLVTKEKYYDSAGHEQYRDKIIDFSDTSDNNNRLSGATITGWSDDTGVLYTTYGPINFINPGSVISGWTGNTYTVTTRSGRTLATTSIYLGTALEPGTNDPKFYAYWLNGSNPQWITSEPISVSITDYSGIVPATYTRGNTIKVGNAVTGYSLSAYWDAAEAQFTPVVVTPIKATSVIRIDDTAVTLYEAGSGTIYDRGESVLGRETLSSGGYMYYPAGTATTYYNAGTVTKVDRGSTVTVTPISSTSAIRLGSSGTYYTAGTKVRKIGNKPPVQYTGTLYVNGTISAGSGSWYLNVDVYEKGDEITPVGDSVTARPVVSSGGTIYYQAASQQTWYRGDGGSFTQQGSSVSVTPISSSLGIRLSAQQTYYRGNGGAYTPQGTAQDAYKKVNTGGTFYYQANSQQNFYRKDT